MLHIHVTRCSRFLFVSLVHFSFAVFIYLKQDLVLYITYTCPTVNSIILGLYCMLLYKIGYLLSYSVLCESPQQLLLYITLPYCALHDPVALMNEIWRLIYSLSNTQNP